MSGSSPVCSPRRANMASGPGSASSGQGGAQWRPSRTCTRASIASARIAWLESVSAADLQGLEDGTPAAASMARCRQSAPRCSPRARPPEQRQAQHTGVKRAAGRLLRPQRQRSTTPRPPAPADPATAQAAQWRSLRASGDRGQQGSARLELVNTGGHLRHHMGSEKVTMTSDISDTMAG